MILYPGRMGTEVNGSFEPGFIGAPIGSDTYVKEMMKKKVGEVRVEVKKTVSLLNGEKQPLWTCLRSSISHKMEY